MRLTNTRKQWPVGQGFFHSAELSQDQAPPVRYVYDCGAKSLYKSVRSKRIDDVLTSIGAKAMLDLLFLSHVHEDHVNGVEQLLNQATGLQGDTIVLPLINVEDRLIAYTRSITDDPAAADSVFYQDFIVEPVEALSRFNPRQILFVRPGEPDDGAPGSGDGPIVPVDHESGFSVRRDKGRTAWKLVGKGTIDRGAEGTTGAPSTMARNVWVVPDSMALALPLNSATRFWLLAPFVDPEIVDRQIEFLDALSHELAMTTVELKIWLRDVGNVRSLVVGEVTKLKAAYGALVGDLNVTSMSLYSGPAHFDPTDGFDHQIHFSKWRALGNGRVAWLATGDAALRELSRRTEFLAHYGNLLKNVVAFTLPHHGADPSFHEDLLAGVSPDFCIVAADKYRDWRHPGPHVIQSVASSGRFLFVVTSNNNSAITEFASVRGTYNAKQ